MMFEVVSAETKLDAARSSDPDVVGSGGRVLWMPTSGLVENEIISTGSVFFYHRVLGVTYTVKAQVPDGISLSLADGEDRGRADFREVRFESPSLQVNSKQSVLPSDALVCEYGFINNGSDPVDVTVELILQNDFDDSSARVRSFEARDDALEIDKYLGVKDEPTLRVRGVATLSHRDDEVALVTNAGAGSELPLTASEYTQGSITRTLTLAAGAQDSVRASFALTESMVQSRVAARLAIASNSVIGATHNWIGYLGSCPELTCENALVEQSFASGWIDARILSSRSTVGANPYREVFAGSRTGRFADAHAVTRQVRSERWNQLSAFGTSALLNFVHLQRADGALPTRIDYGRVPVFGTDCPDWSVFWDHYLVHPDDNYLRRAYHALADYARYVDAVGDAEGSGLVDNEIVRPEAETIFSSGRERSRLKGVANSINHFKMKLSLKAAATRLGLHFDAEDWERQSDAVGSAIQANMWDPGTSRFCNIDKGSGAFVQTETVDAVLPYTTGVATSEHVAGLLALVDRHLAAVDDELADQRPYPIEEFVYALAFCGDRFHDPILMQHASSEFLRGLSRSANAVSAARSKKDDAAKVGGTKASQSRRLGSSTIDLIIRFACGVLPDENAIEIRPLPLLVEPLEIDKLVIRNNHVGVWCNNDQFGVRLDGEDIYSANLGESITLDIPL